MKRRERERIGENCISYNPKRVNEDRILDFLCFQIWKSIIKFNILCRLCEHITCITRISIYKVVCIIVVIFEFSMRFHFTIAYAFPHNRLHKFFGRWSCHQVVVNNLKGLNRNASIFSSNAVCGLEHGF